MIYENIEDCQEVIEKVWGQEFWISNIPEYCGKVLVLNQKHRCSRHYHKLKKETFFIISGLVLLELDPKQVVMLKPGMSVTIAPYQRHRFTGVDKISEIIEFSSQHFEDDSHREELGGMVPEGTWTIIMEGMA